MKDLKEKEKKTRCANEGCRKPAEEESLFCASCGLEWTLFHRDARGQKVDIRSDTMSR
jgi:rRNA maturation endonuclease Nob1